MSKYFILLISAFICFNTYAQQLHVTGTVIGAEDGLPIPGVSVVVKGTSTGTITDIDGKYALNANMGDVLVFSFIGMKSLEETVSSAVLDAKLKADVVGIEEVVAIGYGTVKKKELTGAVARVKSEEITKTVTSDVGTALQGLVAGVNVTASSGQPGEGASILIRGVTSIEGSNTPLYVVDGVPYENDPRLSPNEIETIDVLKDAASCAIYGARGASGVILITTKSGKAGTMKVSLNATYGIQDIRSGTPLMNSTEQVYSDLLSFRNQYNSFDDETRIAMLRSAYYFNNNTDLNKYVFINNSATQDYSLNIAGGKEDLTYNVTVGYYDQEGVVVNSGFERFNTRISTTYKHNKWNIGANVGLTLEERDNAPAGIITQAIKYHPTNPDLDLSNDGPIYSYGDNEATNINWVLDSFRNEDHRSRVNTNANFSVNYNLIKGLNLNARLAIRALNDYRHEFKPYQAVYDADLDLKSDPEKDSYVAMTASKTLSTTLSLGATYRKSIKKHNITMFLGEDIEEHNFSSFGAEKDYVLNNNIKTLDGALSNPMAVSSGPGVGDDYSNKLVGFIGRLQYNYKSKYLFSASLRHDGSSKFGKDYTWGTFPSASASWVISDEGFFSGLNSTINTFKLRGSLGSVGNESIGPYGYSAGIVNGADYIFNNEKAPGSAQASFANAKVKWETSIQTNIGVDLAFLSNKITLAAEYYSTTNREMLMPITIAGSNGSLPTLANNMQIPTDNTVVLNVGNMINQGVELAVGYKAKTGDIKWNLNGTFSTNKNEVTKIIGLGGYTETTDNGLIAGRADYSKVTVIAEGYEAGAFFIYETNGIVKTQEQLDAYKQVRTDAKMGDLIYVDQLTVDTDGDGKADTGDGVIDSNDRVYKGSGLPDYEIGLNISADYKGFDFSMQWYSALGHEIMNGAKATAYAWNRHKDMTSQWTITNPDSNIPAYRESTHWNYYGNTDLWLEDGSFIRLKNVTLGYTLPKTLTTKAGIEKCRVFVNAQNPLTFTKYEGYDPEVGGVISRRGLDKGNYPVTSLYSVGVNINF